MMAQMKEAQALRKVPRRVTNAPHLQPQPPAPPRRPHLHRPPPAVYSRAIEDRRCCLARPPIAMCSCSVSSTLKQLNAEATEQPCQAAEAEAAAISRAPSKVGHGLQLQP